MFKCFPIVSIWRLSTPGAWPNLTGTIYNGDYLTVLYTKYRSSGSSGFREEDFLKFSHCKSMGDICCHENHNFDTICSKT